MLAGLLVGVCLDMRPAIAQPQDRGHGDRIRTSENQEQNLYQGSYALVFGVNDYTAGMPDLQI